VEELADIKELEQVGEIRILSLRNSERKVGLGGPGGSADIF
jgi:hypothetical protein